MINTVETVVIKGDVAFEKQLRNEEFSAKGSRFLRAFLNFVRFV